MQPFVLLQSPTGSLSSQNEMKTSVSARDFAARTPLRAGNAKIRICGLLRRPKPMPPLLYRSRNETQEVVLNAANRFLRDESGERCRRNRAAKKWETQDGDRVNETNGERKMRAATGSLSINVMMHHYMKFVTGRHFSCVNIRVRAQRNR